MDVHGLPNPGTMLEKLKDIFRKKLNVHDHLQLHQYTIHSSLVMKVHRIAFLFFQFLSQHPITEPLQSKIGKNHVDSNFRHCICFKIILSYRVTAHAPGNWWVHIISCSLQRCIKYTFIQTMYVTKNYILQHLKSSRDGVLMNYICNPFI